MNDSAIRHFLEDLYAIDPDLRAQEDHLLPLIRDLLQSDPGRAPDARFVEELHTRLKHHARELSALSPEERSHSSLPFFMNRLVYALAGAAAVLVIGGPAVYYGLKTAPATHQASKDLSPIFAYSVTDAPANAFGSLANAQPGSATMAGRGMGGGGNGNISPVPAMAPQNEAASGIATDQAPAADPAMMDSKMIAPGMPYELKAYQYVFSGSLPALPQGTVSVLQRQHGLSRPAWDAIASSFNLGMMDIGSFKSAKLDSFTLSQDTPFGYMISVMIKDGTLSLMQNWEQWPHPESSCTDEACYQRYRLKLTDLPSDDTVLGIADDFVKAHGLDLSRYGQPEMDTQWKREYELMADKSQAYIPDGLTVIYPLLSEGKPVYDQSGIKTGIRVTVNARHKKVSDIWGIQSQSYVRSAYDAVDGSGSVMAFLAALDRMDPSVYPKDTKVTKVQVTLGEPVIGDVVYYNYTNNQQQELIVPSLLFPVQSTSDKDPYFWRHYVIVPLAKELLNQQVNPPTLMMEKPVAR